MSISSRMPSAKVMARLQRKMLRPMRALMWSLSACGEIFLVKMEPRAERNSARSERPMPRLVSRLFWDTCKKVISHKYWF